MTKLLDDKTETVQVRIRMLQRIRRAESPEMAWQQICSALNSLHFDYTRMSMQINGKKKAKMKCMWRAFFTKAGRSSVMALAICYDRIYFSDR